MSATIIISGSLLPCYMTGSQVPGVRGPLNPTTEGELQGWAVALGHEYRKQHAPFFSVSVIDTHTSISTCIWTLQVQNITIMFIILGFHSLRVDALHNIHKKWRNYVLNILCQDPSMKSSRTLPAQASGGEAGRADPALNCPSCFCPKYDGNFPASLSVPVSAAEAAQTALKSFFTCSGNNYPSAILTLPCGIMFNLGNAQKAGSTILNKKGAAS